MSNILNIGVVNDLGNPAVMTLADGHKHPGFAVEITQLICQALHVDCHYHLSNSSSYGELVNESFTGMLGAINAGFYHTSLPVFSPTVDRTKYFTLGNEYIRMPLYFAVRNPITTDIQSIWAVFKPLAPITWLLVMLITGVTALLVWISSLGRSNKVISQIQNFMLIFINVSAYIVRKGPSIPGLRATGHCLLLAWGLTCILLISSYTSRLLSTMFKIEPSLPFSDIYSLADCVSKQRCTMIFTPAGDWFLQKVSNDREVHYVNLKSALMINPVIRAHSTEEALSYIRNTEEPFIVSWPASKLRFIETLSDPYCRISLVENNHEPLQNTFAFHFNNTTLRDKFDSQMQLLLGTGIVEKVVSNYAPEKTVCSNGKVGKASAKALPIRVIVGALLTLTFGCSIGIAIFIFEIFTFSAFCRIEIRIQ